MNQENELIAEIKETLTRLTASNPTWRLMLGPESLTAPEVIAKLDKDRKFREVIIKHYFGLAIQIEQRAREKLP